MKVDYRWQCRECRTESDALDGKSANKQAERHQRETGHSTVTSGRPAE